MNFFTKIDIPAFSWQIDYKSRLAFFGSCFADNISAQFASRKFKVLANPFGTVYNPLSLAKQIKAIADGKLFDEEDVFQDMRLGNHADSEHCGASWHCWDAHGSLSAKTREECIAKLNNAATQAREFLQKADVVFITLGTAFVYFLKSTCENGESSNETTREQVVSNCHRQDPKLFERRMISVDEAATAIREIVEGLCKIKNDRILRPNFNGSPTQRPQREKMDSLPSVDNDCVEKSHSTENRKSESRALHIVFTVSPLRHLSDGAHENTLSKATLQLAIEKVIRKIDTNPEESRNDNSKHISKFTASDDDNFRAVSKPAITVSYFPSYEIVMDELRDYRFYDDDMIHLSKTAEGYIFERMAETYCSEKTREDIRKVEKFMKMVNHRVVDSQSPASREFAQKIIAQAETLEKEITGLHLNNEK